MAITICIDLSLPFAGWPIRGRAYQRDLRISESNAEDGNGSEAGSWRRAVGPRITRPANLSSVWLQTTSPRDASRAPLPGNLASKATLDWFFQLERPCDRADDLIASYTRKAVAAGQNVVIATNDKDILQLTSEHVVHLFDRQS